MKIFAGQTRTAARTVYLGDLAVDNAHCLSRAVSLYAYSGKDLQSDAEAARLLHCMAPASVDDACFCGHGGFVYNLVASATLAPWWDPHLSGDLRGFLCAFAYYFWHAARAYIAKQCSDAGWPPAVRQRLFLAPSSFYAATSCCAHMICRSFRWGRASTGASPDEAYGCRDGCLFEPSEQHERVCEHAVACWPIPERNRREAQQEIQSWGARRGAF